MGPITHCQYFKNGGGGEKETRWGNKEWRREKIKKMEMAREYTIGGNEKPPKKRKG